MPPMPGTCCIRTSPTSSAMSLDWPYGLMGTGGVSSVTGSSSGLPYTAHVLLYTSCGNVRQHHEQGQGGAGCRASPGVPGMGRLCGMRACWYVTARLSG